MPGDPLAPHAATPAELRERLAAERMAVPFLVFRDDGDRQRIVALPSPASRLTIGRSAACDISLPWDAEVSRLHAELERVGDDWVVRDDRLSHNGTFVGGDRVDGRRRLRPGDVVTVGTTQLAFVSAGGPEPATRTAGRPAAAIAVTPAQRRVLIALCRPLGDGGAPASNRAIATELVVALDTVKGTLSRLFDAFGIGADVPQNQKRAALARRALQLGVVRRDELRQ